MICFNLKFLFLVFVAVVCFDAAMISCVDSSDSKEESLERLMISKKLFEETIEAYESPEKANWPKREKRLEEAKEKLAIVEKNIADLEATQH